MPQSDWLQSDNEVLKILCSSNCQRPYGPRQNCVRQCAAACACVPPSRSLKGLVPHRTLQSGVPVRLGVATASRAWSDAARTLQRIHHPGGGGTAPDRRDPFGPRQFSDFSRHYVSLPFNPPYLPSSGTGPFPRREYHERWEAALRSSDPATQLKVVRRAAEVAEAHGLSAIKRA
ncbi:hypothetical protein HPB47_022372 [Ixodes persulcatus]|uniref:Uncharacterized protein n=1 Tax=Ixodes persulcatus TaxID=34615 RepID=A0AC60Q9Y4_IXOPE|nr:hypothetical protein HPB47_022372 [Ixodes persulcatus]